jgi:hypothetical protein
MKARQGILGACLLITFIALMAGCAAITKENIATGTTAYNLAAEKVQNEMLLLNIVRASKRRPMHFTTLSSIQAGLSYSVSTGNATIPVGRIGAATGLYSLTPSASYTTNPIFTVGVPNTKQFVQGMMSPVSPQVLYDFWQEGWPRKMLLHLFVHRIETRGGKTFSNNPAGSEFPRFQKLIKNLKCELLRNKSMEMLGPEMDADKIGMKDLLEIQKAGLTLEKRDQKYQLLDGRKSGYVLACESAKDEGQPDEATYEFGFDEPMDRRGTQEESRETGTIYLRSPGAILHYLGAIMRAEEAGRKIEIDNGQCLAEELFIARRANQDDKSPFVSVDYEGTRYIIPNTDSGQECPDDLSASVLWLLSQLIAKQQSASELPPTPGVVTTIGR